MIMKESGATFALLLALSFAVTQRVQASTVTVVPSEVQTQVQASINNSHVGDTISFQAGTYTLSHLRLQPGRSYLGATNGQTIIHGNGGNSVMDFYGTGLTVQHFIFDGGGLYLGGSASGAKIEYNTFRNISYGPNGTTEFGNWTSTVGIFVDSSLSNSDISYNAFQNLSSQILHQSTDKNLGVAGIFGYGFSNTTITYNTFDTVNEGIKVFFDHADGKNVHVNHNTFTNVHRMAIEMQDSSTSGLEVAYNNVSKPLAPWKLTFGISVPVGGSNTTVHDNIIDDQLQSVCGPGCWVGIGLEVAGTATKVTNNTVRGYWAAGIAVGTSTNMLVENNVICGPDMKNIFVSNETSSHSGEVFTNNVTSTATYCSK
jgi:parallel beta-helix repeat protein